MLLKEDNLDFDTTQISDISEKYGLSENDTRQALAIIFMKQVLEKVNKNDMKVTEAIIKLDNIIEFSRDFIKEEIEEANEEPEDSISEDNAIDIIKEAHEILANEKELVNSINEEEFSKYLAQSINENTEESIKYQIVSILLALHSELEKYNNIKEIEKLKDMVLTNIKDYIEAYKTLKSKLK